MQNKQDVSANLKAELSCYTGTENWYRHVLRKDFLYTDGVQYFANAGDGCYWFLDIIATEIWPIQKTEPFLVIELEVQGSKADIRVTDGNGNSLWHRKIAWTDAPEGLWRFYLTDNVCLLPSEY